ncbi:MAG: carboxymuconolactone decarboxylase family protein [Verrucomicrobiota bacterium]
MNRIDYYKENPELFTKLREIRKEFDQFTLDARLRAVIELRVSQINGCGYCIDLHSHEARVLGEDQQRLDMLPVWNESSFFDDRERAALAWAESVTMLSERHPEDFEYQEILKFFSEQEVVELTLIISMANFWNRIAVSFNKHPIRKNA